MGSYSYVLRVLSISVLYSIGDSLRTSYYPRVIYHDYYDDYHYIYYYDWKFPFSLIARNQCINIRNTLDEMYITG